MRVQAQVTPSVRGRTPVRQGPGKVEISDAMESVQEANGLLLTAQGEASPFRAMALMVATRSTHGRMQRLLASLEDDDQVDAKTLARAREWLNLFAESLGIDATDHLGVVERCGRYLAAAHDELQRLGKAVVASKWRPSRSLPGYYRL